MREDEGLYCDGCITTINAVKSKNLETAALAAAVTLS